MVGYRKDEDLLVESGLFGRLEGHCGVSHSEMAKVSLVLMAGFRENHDTLSVFEKMVAFVKGRAVLSDIFHAFVVHPEGWHKAKEPQVFLKHFADGEDIRPGPEERSSSRTLEGQHNGYGVHQAVLVVGRNHLGVTLRKNLFISDAINFPVQEMVEEQADEFLEPHVV